MSDQPSRDPPDLAGAVRRARLEQAERSGAIGEIRSAEVARLELLHDAIRPLLAQVPQHIDLFDAGVTRGDHPRLFLDMIGFVELDRDGRTYRLVQDSRHGRIVIAETEQIETAVAEISAYVAHRLVEREKALAADTTLETAARRLGEPGPVDRHASSPPPAAMRTERLIDVTSVPLAVPASPRRRRRSRLARALQFVVEFLGSVSLLLLLMGLGFFLYHAARAWLAAHYGFAPE